MTTRAQPEVILYKNTDLTLIFDRPPLKHSMAIVKFCCSMGLREPSLAPFDGDFSLITKTKSRRNQKWRRSLMKRKMKRKVTAEKGAERGAVPVDLS